MASEEEGSIGLSEDDDDDDDDNEDAEEEEEIDEASAASDVSDENEDEDEEAGGGGILAAVAARDLARSAASAPRTPEMLALALERRGAIRSASVGAAFRRVDRAEYAPPRCRRCAFDDAPSWRPAYSLHTILLCALFYECVRERVRLLFCRLRARDDEAGCVVHLSAPSIYAAALEALQLEPRQSFLNVGSGSGSFGETARLRGI